MSLASSSSSSSAPHSSSKVSKHQVFVSFRGEDTGRIVDYLYTALEQQGIRFYKGYKTLPRGESIGPSLVTAIEESKIAVVIFSKNYADSPWCLDELAHIMKCMDKRDQMLMVMPIFYDIGPFEVRKQEGRYGEAFAKHKSKNNKKVESWRKALADVSNFNGYEINYYRYESDFIEEIVDTISWTLNIGPPTGRHYLVGIAARMQRLESELQIGSGGVLMIGICGLGGGGKTTLASSIYEKISTSFDGCCFLRNILEKSIKYGLTRLQKQILFVASKKKHNELYTVDQGKSMIRGSLYNRKVLIVLDDVDHLYHLQALAGSHDWFGEGSRIIITTRNEHLLTEHKVDVIHSISLLNNDEAIELFHKHAYPRYKPMEDNDQKLKDVVSVDVVSYAGGLPLALQTVSHFLSDKGIDKWRSAFARLILMPDQKSHIHNLIAADTKNRRAIYLNIEWRDLAQRSLSGNFLPRVQKQRKYFKEDLFDAIIEPLFPNEHLIIDQNVEHLKIPLRKLVLETNNFSEEYIISRGGFGNVYKAQYEDNIVALKKLDGRHGQGDRQFKIEISILSAYKHENIVSLVGFCEEGGEKILVYKYESNGSLDKHLQGKDLSWIQLLQICLDAARGLRYLHDEVGTHHRIIHRDIKSSNILLDENFRAKISDFGFSKIALANAPHTALISVVCGTLGYFDPEYYEHGILTQKTDVYSFGVVMFEVLCGKVVGVSKHLDGVFSAKLAKYHYEMRTLDEIIDLDLRNQMNPDSLSTFSTIAHQCLESLSKERPRMSMVVKEVEKALGQQVNC